MRVCVVILYKSRKYLILIKRVKENRRPENDHFSRI